MDAFLLTLVVAPCPLYSPQVTRVRSQGTVDVVFNVALKDLHRFGYRNGAESNAVTA